MAMNQAYIEAVQASEKKEDGQKGKEKNAFLPCFVPTAIPCCVQHVEV